jgi:YbgC/YbaW family acyl-CoA thioester hydrolase
MNESRSADQPQILDVSKVPAHDYEVRIREKLLDAFGHVNNAQYMVLFEEARWEMITSRGYGLKEILDLNVGTVVLESTIRYQRELKNREKIIIRTSLLKSSRKIFVLGQSMIKESGEIASEAQFTVGCFDLKSRKLIQPTAAWLNAIQGK